MNRYKIAPIASCFQIRSLSTGRYVVEVHWPSGAVEQLVGVFTSEEHARQWLVNYASALPLRQSSQPAAV